MKRDKKKSIEQCSEEIQKKKKPRLKPTQDPDEKFYDEKHHRFRQQDVLVDVEN